MFDFPHKHRLLYILTMGDRTSIECPLIYRINYFRRTTTTHAECSIIRPNDHPKDIFQAWLQWQCKAQDLLSRTYPDFLDSRTIRSES